MAKTSGPLLSLEAHGTLAKTLNYSQRKSGSQCRKYNKPLKIPTPAQRGQRRLTEFLVAQWQNMSDADKATWTTNAAASGLALSGYHYFLKQAQRNLYLHHGLWGYWSLNEIVAGQVLDITRQGHNGDLKPTYPSNSPVLVPGKSKRFSNALSFDGSDDTVEFTAANSLKSALGTWECWVKHTENFLSSRGILHHGEAGYNRQLSMKTTTVNRLQCYCREGTEGYPYAWVIFAPANSIPLNTWCHVALVQDGISPLLYINGVFIAGIAGGANLAAWSIDLPPFLFHISFPAGGGLYKGLIDEVCVYNRALSASEIKARYDFAMNKTESN